MLIRVFFLFAAFIYHLTFNEIPNSLLALYIYIFISSATYFIKLDNIFDIRIWFVPLFTITNSLAIFSEEYLLGGVNILPYYSPLKIVTSLFIFNIFVEISASYFRTITFKTSAIYSFSLSKTLLILLVSYLYFIFDFIRLGGFEALGSYGEDQYDYSIYNLLTNLFTITWIISVIIVSLKLKGTNLLFWFSVNICFILITKVLIGYRYFMFLLLIIILFRIFKSYKVNKLLLFFSGIAIFYIHLFLGVYRSGEGINPPLMLFQLGAEFSIISQINYVVFNEFQNFKFGYSFLSALINIIPGARAFFTDYLFMPALYFNNELVVKSENQGYGFSFLSELYMNFGIFGSAIGAMICTYINTFMSAGYGSVKWILTPILMYLLTRILRSDSIEFVKIISYSYFLVLFLRKKN